MLDMPKPKQTTKWLYGMPFWHGVVYRCSTFTLSVIGFFLWRVKLRDMDKLPKKEPYLLLGNHSCMFDPFWAGIYVPRGIKSMASAAVLNVPYLGVWLRLCGCFPKMKFTKDRNSMRLLQENYEAGYPILLFPEGNRSWDGRIGPVSKGIGRLIKRLGCKVVYVRLPTASLFQPRWATYPRWVPIEVQYDGPYEYDDEWSVDDIWQDVVQKITVDPKIIGNPRTFGFRMAHGLPNYLWACPNCFTLDGLKVAEHDSNCVECAHCSASWELTVENKMLGDNEMTVSTAFDRIADHFGDNPKIDKETFETTGVALSCSEATILKRNTDTNKMETFHRGTLEITTEGLKITNPNEEWQVLHGEITGISVEIANLLQFRIDGVAHRIVTPSQSSLLWHFFLMGWQPKPATT